MGNSFSFLLSVWNNNLQINSRLLWLYFIQTHDTVLCVRICAHTSVIIFPLYCFAVGAILFRYTTNNSTNNGASSSNNRYKTTTTKTAATNLPATAAVTIVILTTLLITMTWATATMAIITVITYYKISFRLPLQLRPLQSKCQRENTSGNGNNNYLYITDNHNGMWAICARANTPRILGGNEQ